MYRLLYKIYSLRFIQRYNKLEILYFRFFNFLINFLFEYSIFKPKLKETNNDIIVSLTSFPERLPFLHLVIESILHQSIKPAKIILWLCREEVSNDSLLPPKLLKLKERGLEIEYVNENLRSHLKYYFTFKKYPNFNIITIDDDYFYHPNIISNFIKYSKIYPDAIIANSVRKINVVNNKFDDYKNWTLLTKFHEPHTSILKLGVGGVFYPPKSLNDEVFNIELIKNYALFTDDLWLKFANKKPGFLTMCICDSYASKFIPVYGTLKTRNLAQENIGNLNNDKVMKKLTHLLELNPNDFK